METEAPILVVGATGTQGGFTARNLLAAGRRVRVLVRDPACPKALELEALGAELVQGDLNAAETLDNALVGVCALFSVQRPDDGTNSELRQGLGLVAAARRAGIDRIVHSSVCQVDERASFPGWAEGRWDRKYWDDKWAVEEAVREGFLRWTILRPSFIMQNLLPPKATALYPSLLEGKLLSPIDETAIVQLVAGEDIGRIAAAALSDPARFNGKTIELAGDSLTLSEIAETLAQTVEVPVVARSVSAAEAIADGQPAKWVRSQEWINEIGYNVDETRFGAFGLEATTFAAWASTHRNAFSIRSPHEDQRPRKQDGP